MIQTKYANAYTEVYEILSCLSEEEYSKIPEELIEVFEENRNLDYDYEVNEEQDLMDQPMLRETKAILLNIFRDYLATPEQSQKIKMWLQLDREYLEKQKREKYNTNIFENKIRKNEDSASNFNTNLPATIKKQTILQKIINKIKKIFKI